MSLIKGLPKKPELTEQVVDISTMSNTELLKHILELYRLKYKLLEIKNRSKIILIREQMLLYIMFLLKIKVKTYILVKLKI